MGSGTIATLVDGINFVANSNLTNRIASMSLGGGKADALNDAVEAAVKAGVLVIVAAGNEATDACEISPGETCFLCCSSLLCTVHCKHAGVSCMAWRLKLGDSILG
jgi:subtilisin family serine protease